MPHISGENCSRYGGVAFFPFSIIMRTQIISLYLFLLLTEDHCEATTVHEHLVARERIQNESESRGSTSFAA